MRCLFDRSENYHLHKWLNYHVPRVKHSSPPPPPPLQSCIPTYIVAVHNELAMKDLHSNYVPEINEMRPKDDKSTGEKEGWIRWNSSIWGVLNNPHRSKVRIFKEISNAANFIYYHILYYILSLYFHSKITWRVSNWYPIKSQCVPFTGHKSGTTGHFRPCETDLNYTRPFISWVSFIIHKMSNSLVKSFSTGFNSS